MIIRLAKSPGDIAAVRQLWLEYWESIGLPMDFQGFGEERNGLPGVYGEAGGVLLLALDQEQPSGTIALRRLDGRSVGARHHSGGPHGHRDPDPKSARHSALAACDGASGRISPAGGEALLLTGETFGKLEFRPGGIRRGDRC